MSVTFELGATSVTIRSPERGNASPISLHQAVGRTAGGKLFAYDKGIALRRLVLQFTELTQDEADDLAAFFETAAVGVTNTFTYTDHHGAEWTARFLSTELDWRERDDAADGGEGIWDLDIELEVTAA